MKKIFIFYTILSALLILAHVIRENSPHKIPTSQISSVNLVGHFLETKLEKNFKQITLNRAYIRLITGLKMDLDYRIEKIIDRLNLWPLFAMNGLHLILFFNFFLKKRSRFRLYFKFLFTWYNPTIWRTSFINFIERLSEKLNFKSNETMIFYLGCLFTLFIGLLGKSFESTLFSLIFIGYFYFSHDQNKLDSLLLFIISVLLICIYFQKSFSFFAFFISILLLEIFKKSYFLLLIIFILAIFTTIPYLEVFVKSSFYGLKVMGTWTSFDRLNSTFFLLISLGIFLYKKDFRILIIYLLFHAEPVYSPAIYYSK